MFNPLYKNNSFQILLDSMKNQKTYQNGFVFGLFQINSSHSRWLGY